MRKRFVEENFDFTKELERLGKEQSKLESLLLKIEKKLTPDFLEFAPPEIVEKEKESLRLTQEQLKQINERIFEILWL